MTPARPDTPPQTLQLGVCWYPEQWPESRWAEDARRMRELGLRVVRIAEFAWSRMEPAAGQFDWDWLDRAIATLAAEGLQLVLGTPTASPPLWLMQAHPDIAPVGADGRPKTFGSRRHYDFSSPAFREATVRIVTAMARRYGRHPAVIAWQTDNEYGCHDTVLSWSPAALAGFRRWLATRYGHIDALNTAWGTAFWGLQLASFEDVVLPVGQPTTPLPAHLADFRRFASDEVVAYNRLQVQILREHAPGHALLHNYMGFSGDFDHHATGQDLDIAAWDNYPLGFIDISPFMDEPVRHRYGRTGHPDFSAFHHDLYRAVGHGRTWVMEQQAGPVNWAPWNALPLPGMVRAWTWEAFAHGAELVSYFRWRQVPYGPEQMHSGLNRPDFELDTGGHEAARVAAELAALAQELPTAGCASRVAVVLCYDNKRLMDLQAHGADMPYFGEVFRYYHALRRLGLDVDLVGPQADLAGYALLVLPALLCPPPALLAQLPALQAAGTVVVAGPRLGSKTVNFEIPTTLAPSVLATQMPVRVQAVESMRPGRRVPVLEGGQAVGEALRWRDLAVPRGAVAHDGAGAAPHTPAGTGSGGLQVRARHADDWPAWCTQGRWHWHASVVDDALLRRWLAVAAAEAGLVTQELPEGLRLRRRGQWQFAINHGPDTAQVPAPAGTRFLLGGPALVPAGVALWRVEAS